MLTFVPTQKKIEPKLLRFAPWEDHLSRRQLAKVERGIRPEELAPEILVRFSKPFKG